MSKNFLKFMSPKTLDKLENLGIFRNPFESSFYMDFNPWICKNIQTKLSAENHIKENLEQWLMSLQTKEIAQNKQTIEKFFLDCEDRKNERIRLQLEKEERIRKRKEEKARLAEIKRRQELKSFH